MTRLRWSGGLPCMFVLVVLALEVHSKKSQRGQEQLSKRQKIYRSPGALQRDFNAKCPVFARRGMCTTHPPLQRMCPSSCQLYGGAAVYSARYPTLSRYPVSGPRAYPAPYPPRYGLPTYPAQYPARYNPPSMVYIQGYTVPESLTIGKPTVASSSFNRSENFQIKGKFFKSIGCWRDSPASPAIPSLEGKHELLKGGDHKNRANALMKCAQVALEKKLFIFALQDGGMCMGKVGSAKTFKKHGPSTQCYGDGEGGVLSNEVYSFLDEAGKPVIPQDGNYTLWSPWTPCSQSCGVGQQSRNRTCSNPPPMHGGSACTSYGAFYQAQPCVVTATCPGATTPKPAELTTAPAKPTIAPATPAPPPPEVKGSTPAGPTPAPLSSGRPTSAAPTITDQPISVTTPRVCKAKVDLGFVVDGSGSVGSQNFRKQLKFIQELTKAFEISNEETHIGLVVYDHRAKVAFGFDQFYDQQSVVQAISRIQHPRGGTKTGLALTTALNELFVKNARRGVPNMLVVITDGQSSDDVSKPAQMLRDSGVTIFALGVGRHAVESELNSISTDPDAQHTFVVESFDALTSIIQTIKDRACQGAGGATQPPPTSLPARIVGQTSTPAPTDSSVCVTKVDLAFLIDASSSIEFQGAGNFKKCLNFVKRMVSFFQVSKAGTHVGVVVFSKFARLEFGFEQFYDQASIRQAINNIRYLNSGTFTGNGLRKVKSNLFERSARQGVPNVLIVLTDGASQDDIVQRSHDLHNMGVIVFCIGVGSNIDRSQLNVMATDPDSEHVFTANFDALDSVVDAIREKTCKGSGGVVNRSLAPPPSMVQADKTTGAD